MPNEVFVQPTLNVEDCQEDVAYNRRCIAGLVLCGVVGFLTFLSAPILVLFLGDGLMEILWVLVALGFLIMLGAFCSTYLWFDNYRKKDAKKYLRIAKRQEADKEKQVESSPPLRSTRQPRRLSES